MSKAMVEMVMILVHTKKDVQILVRVKKDVQILAAAAGRHSHFLPPSLL